VTIKLTDPGAPFSFRTVGLTDAVTPGGRIFPMLNVTGLGMLEVGVTVTGVVVACPYTTLTALLERLKSGMVTTIPLLNAVVVV
jgi:hypothetical protein